MEKPGHVTALKNSPDSSGGHAGTNSRNIADEITCDALQKKTPSWMEGVLEKEGLVYLLHSILREKYMMAANIRNKPILPASNAPSCN